MIVIVSDDSRTALEYFARLKQELKQKVTIKISGGRCDETSPKAVVDRALAEQQTLRSEQQPNERQRDALWVLLDLEGNNAQLRIAREQRKRAEAENISVAMSKPCYEVWTLLHLEDTGEHFENCAAVMVRLKQTWRKKFGHPLGPKSKGDYSKIIDRRLEAAKRARRHYMKPPRDPSWTEVFQVIEVIERLVNETDEGAT